MEKFNIELFKSLAKDDEYTKVLNDGTTIDQFEFKGGYGEKITPKKGWFYEYKEFYPNGELKIKGKCFSRGDFKAGTWIEADINGNISRETDYDKQYNLSIDSIFKILQEKKIPFSYENTFNKISRNIVNSKAVWSVFWKVTFDRVEFVKIDDSTGKIIEQSFFKFQDSN